jgi:DNA-binding CsgD family transcriptional regulator
MHAKLMEQLDPARRRLDQPEARVDPSAPDASINPGAAAFFPHVSTIVAAALHDGRSDWGALTASFDALPLPTAVKCATGEILYANVSFQNLVRSRGTQQLAGVRLDMDPGPDPRAEPWHVRAKWTWLCRSDGMMLESLAVAVLLDATANLTLYLFIETHIPHWRSATQPEPHMALDPRSRLAALTQRELEVLKCLLRGMSNKAVARDLDISPRTVEVHRGRLLRKLGVQNVAQAVGIAVAAGLDSSETPAPPGRGASPTSSVAGLSL